MRTCLLLLFLSPLFAQAPEAPHADHDHKMPPPKNLKLLKPDEVMPAMHSFRIALGVKCDFCHVPGDFASDEKHHKEIARHMIELVNDVNGKFPDGKVHVTCYTCHRGSEEPATAPPATENMEKK